MSRLDAGNLLPSPDPSVAALVVNFNGGEKVLRCLRALQAQSVPFREVLVVDNASADDSVARIGRELPLARVLSLT